EPKLLCELERGLRGGHQTFTAVTEIALPLSYEVTITWSLYMPHMQFRVVGVALLSVACLGGLIAPGEPAKVRQGAPALELVQTVPLKGKAGRLDHMALDSKGARLFVANLSNDSFDVVDLNA